MCCESPVSLPYREYCAGSLVERIQNIKNPGTARSGRRGVKKKRPEAPKMMLYHGASISGKKNREDKKI
jgi:hypothetical protein